MKRILNKETIRYVTVGVLTQLIGLASFVVLNFFINYLIADVIGNTLAFIFNYLGHKFFTFKKPTWKHSEAWKYLLNITFHYANSFVSLYVLVEIFDLNELLAKMLLLIIVTFTNYFVLKKLVFRD